MATVTRTTTWADSQVLTATALNTEFNNLLNALSIVNADISASAGIVYSKLSLTGGIVNADISGSAAIALSKIALTTSAQLASAISDETGSGALVFGTSPSLATPTITKPVMSATNPTAQTYSPAGGGTATLDLSLSNQHYITMPAGNATIALSNDTNNQIFLVSITQDSVGSRTVTWFTTIKWAGGSPPTLTTTANKRDTFGFIRTGSGTYDGFVIGQNI